MTKPLKFENVLKQVYLNFISLNIDKTYET